MIGVRMKRAALALAAFSLLTSGCLYQPSATRVPFTSRPGDFELGAQMTSGGFQGSAAAAASEGVAVHGAVRTLNVEGNRHQAVEAGVTRVRRDHPDEPALMTVGVDAGLGRAWGPGCIGCLFDDELPEIHGNYGRIGAQLGVGGEWQWASVAVTLRAEGVYFDHDRQSQTPRSWDGWFAAGPVALARFGGEHLQVETQLGFVPRWTGSDRIYTTPVVCSIGLVLRN